MQKITYKSLAVTVVTAFCFVMVGSLVNAAPNARAEEGRQNAGERKEVSQTKPAVAKLKACQKREEKIRVIMMRIAERGKKQIEVFDKIAERTKAFYEEKGKTLATYETLVAEVDEKRAAAQEAIDTIESSSQTFVCDENGSQSAAQSFKTSLKAEIEALKEYKTAVKNLIVGVKSVQGKTSSAENNSNQGEIQ